METVYVAMRAISFKDMMALKATVEPMLMRASKQVMPHVTRTAFRGDGSGIAYRHS